VHQSRPLHAEMNAACIVEKNWGIRITSIFIKVLKILNEAHISVQMCLFLNSSK